MILIVIAASVALMLGVIGIYGVMSYIVSQRTGEIGVRLALGADPGHVAGMIIRQGALVALAGVIVGLGLAYAGSRLIASLLYGVSARDPVVFAATTVLLLSVALTGMLAPCATWRSPQSSRGATDRVRNPSIDANTPRGPRLSPVGTALVNGSDG